MNAARRKEIASAIETARSLITTLEEIKTSIDEFKSSCSDLADTIEGIRDEEQEYFDNMPESFLQADRGQVAEAAISALDAAIDAVRELDNLEFDADLDETISGLEEAQS
jgi:uncharacterized coiled-coil DUF342 family protein